MFNCFKKKKVKETRPEHWKIAKDFLGTKEVAGSGNNSIIVDMFRVVVGKEYPDSTAWCAAFVGSVLDKAGFKTSNKLNARSYLNYGVPVSKPEIGDIVILWRESKKSWKGHVGFYAGKGPGYIKVLGGNQNNEVNITRYPAYRLLGYRAVMDVIK